MTPLSAINHKHLPRVGGGSQNVVASSMTPLSAIPAISEDKTYKLSDIDRSALITIIKDIPHGTMIRYNVIYDLYGSIDNDKTFNIVTLITLILIEYMDDNDWNFLIIGNDERALELNDNTELAYGVVCLGEADQCLGSYGVNETHFQL
eukprot:4668330-Heterocapsa_arctica.AAC.1